MGGFRTTACGIHILELTDEETGNVETIKVTAEHPFYVEATAGPQPNTCHWGCVSRTLMGRGRW